MLNLDQLREAATQRCRESFDGVSAWSPFDWAGATCGAAGKATDLCRRIQLGEPVDPELVLRELATAVIYADLTAAALAGDLGAAVVEEFNRKSAEIGSPIQL